MSTTVGEVVCQCLSFKSSRNHLDRRHSYFPCSTTRLVEKQTATESNCAEFRRLIKAKEASSYFDTRTTRSHIRSPLSVIHIHMSYSATETRLAKRKPLERARPGYSLFSMGTNLYEEEARQLLHTIAPHLAIARVHAVPSIGIQQVYRVNVAGRQDPILFTLQSHPWVKPLRSERSCIPSEAVLWTWLSMLSPGVRVSPTTFGEGAHIDPSRHEAPSIHPINYISDFLPTLIRYGLPAQEPRIPEHVLSHPRPGVSISSLTGPLDERSRMNVQWQTGQLFRRICCHVSPTGKFGDIMSVLRPMALIPMKPFYHTASNSPYIFGSASWSDGFQLMLEDVLRDLEDRFVNVGYIRIRGHFSRLRHLLDKVTRPSLVAVHFHEDENILVLPAGDYNMQCDYQRPSFPPTGREIPSAAHTQTIPFLQTGDVPQCGSRQYGAGSRNNNFIITGLQDWSGFLFGDPLIATVFTNAAPSSFVNGLHTPISKSDPLTTVPVIEDPQFAPVRLLLYNCYYALKSIAKEYYQSGEGDLELEARRWLAHVMRKLDDIDDDGNLIESYEEVSPSKRVRINHDFTDGSTLG